MTGDAAGSQMPIAGVFLAIRTNFDPTIGPGRLISSGENPADANFTYTSGVPIHVAYAVTTTGYTIYANGVQVGSGTISGTPLLYNSTHTVRIGNSSSTAE